MCKQREDIIMDTMLGKCIDTEKEHEKKETVMIDCSEMRTEGTW